MEVPLVFLCIAIMATSFPVNHGEPDFGDNDGKPTDMAIDETANTIKVYNTIHVPQTDDMLRSSDMFDKSRFMERPMVRTPLNSRHNFQNDGPDDGMSYDDKERPMVRTLDSRNNFQNDDLDDGMTTMASKIEWLIDSNNKILNIVKSLEHKINRTLDTAAYQDQGDEHYPISPRSTIDLMDNLQVMNLLNKIHQFMISSNGQAQQTNTLEAEQIQVIKDFVGSIKNENMNAMRSSTPDIVDQVLTNSQKTIDHLDEVSAMVKVIDDRTNRILDESCRQEPNFGTNGNRKTDCNCDNDIISHQGPKLSNGYRNDDCNCDNDMIRHHEPGLSNGNGMFVHQGPGLSNGNDMIRRKQYESDTTFTRNERYDRTYQNVKRGANSRVQFEPNKYNCHDLQIRKNGIYKFGSQDEVSNEAGRFFYERYCDFNTDGGAWTVIQRRFRNDHQENFNRSWSDYKLGFGELDKEFWFGNDFIHRLTFDEDVELRIVLEDTNGRKAWAMYSLFRVDSEEYNYNLIRSGYRGSFRIGPLRHNDQEFSTYDRQNENSDNISCASLYGNGWWFNNCTQISTSFDLEHKDMSWENWLGGNFMKSSKMMIRPRGLWSGAEDSGEDGYIYSSNAMVP